MTNINEIETTLFNITESTDSTDPLAKDGYLPMLPVQTLPTTNELDNISHMGVLQQASTFKEDNQEKIIPRLELSSLNLFSY